MANHEGVQEVTSTDPAKEAQDEPWRGERVLPLHPDNNLRAQMGEIIDRVVLEHSGDLGILASELSAEVARRYFEETGQVVFTDSDAILEVSKKLGATIRMAPNRRLYPKRRERDGYSYF